MCLPAWYFVIVPSFRLSSVFHWHLSTPGFSSKEVSLTRGSVLNKPQIRTQLQKKGLLTRGSVLSFSVRNRGSTTVSRVTIVPPAQAVSRVHMVCFDFLLKAPSFSSRLHRRGTVFTAEPPCSGSQFRGPRTAAVLGPGVTQPRVTTAVSYSREKVAVTLCFPLCLCLASASVTLPAWHQRLARPGGAFFSTTLVCLPHLSRRTVLCLSPLP